MCDRATQHRGTCLQQVIFSETVTRALHQSPDVDVTRTSIRRARMATSDAVPPFHERFANSREFRWRLMLLAVFIFAGLFVRTDSVAGASCSSLGEWHQLYWYSAILILTAQMSDTVREFFMGEGPGLLDHAGYFLLGRPYAQAAEEVSRDQVGFWTLMPSGTLPSFHPPLSPPRKAISLPPVRAP